MKSPLKYVRLGLMMAGGLGLAQCSIGGGVEVGAPCTPSLEGMPTFNGFKVTEETIEVGAPECGAGVCLVNHFQGRVSCPLGQPSPTDAQGQPGSCQQPGAPASENAGKACCLPGTDTPVLEAICGQCAGAPQETTRDAENAVYCTCRCGVAEGEPEEPDYDFCACPDGFECSEIRKNYGVGDKTLTGKYCIKAGTAYDADVAQCGQVDGYWSSGGDGPSCAGIGTGQCQIEGGSCGD